MSAQSAAGMLTLRPYQREAVDAVKGALAAGMRRPAVVLPTAAGKTVCFARLGEEFLSELGAAGEQGGRVLVLAHTTELVDQAIKKFRGMAPGLRVGRVQANHNETLARVVVASVQTLRAEQRLRMLRNVRLIIVDECHHAVATSYRTILNWYGALGSDENRSGGRPAVAVGFTATMMRADKLALGDVWQQVVYSKPIAEMIAEGWLVRPRGLHVEVNDLDLSAVKTSRGDYASGDLGEALEASMAPKAIARAVVEHAADRKIVVFTPTVSSSGVIADALIESGRDARVVSGAMPRAERESVLDWLRVTRRAIAVNCMVLSEGFDEPTVDCAVLARPTKSEGLYIQQAGRTLRPSPGKIDALLLDVVGASKVHSLITGIELFGEAPKERDPKERPDGWEDDENPDDLDDGQQDARQALLGGRDGPLVATEVDLFAGSPMAWLRTRAGVWFLAAGERYIAVLPGAPRSQDQWLQHFSGQPYGFTGYDVLALDKQGRQLGPPIASGVPDMSYAQAWAEGEVTPGEKATATKDRRWRAGPPSEKMGRFARSLGIQVMPGARAGEVSSMITLRLASQAIDAKLPAYVKGG